MSTIIFPVDRTVAAVWVATAIVVGLGALHTFLVISGYAEVGGPLEIIDLDAEKNLPAWYASALYLCSGLLLVLTGRLEQAQVRFFWLCLAALMVFMSLDETAGLHEQSRHVADYLGVPDTLFVHSYYQWFAFALPAVVVVVVFSIPMLRTVDRRMAVLCCLSGGLVVLGALGVEILGGLVEEVERRAETPWYRLTVIVEEGLEFSGISLFLTAILGHLARRHSHLDLRLEKASATLQQEPVRVRPTEP
jgi:hypothetical protein